MYFVYRIQLTGEHIVNLINWQDTAYLPSAEVSSFFWEEDVITGVVSIIFIIMKLLCAQLTSP